MANFHRYHADARPRAKQALANVICTALRIHSRIEEELFYPAMGAAGSMLLEDLEPEHEEMRSLIGQLTGMDPASPQFDLTFFELMQTVIHHMADEETMLLPHAESVLGERLGELGGRMMLLRMELTAPHAGEMARDAAHAKPNALLFGAGAVLGAAYLLRRAFR